MLIAIPDLLQQNRSSPRAIFWPSRMDRRQGQSMIRDDARRTMLFDLDVAIQQLSRDVPAHPSIVQLTGVYHNLLRQWAVM